MIYSINEKIAIAGDSLMDFADKVPGETYALIIAGIALSILFPPFIIAFGAIITAKVFVKITESTNSKVMKNTGAINSRFPKLKWIFLIFAVAACWINPVMGGIIGGAAGIYSGMVGIISINNTHSSNEFESLTMV